MRLILIFALCFTPLLTGNAWSQTAVPAASPSAPQGRRLEPLPEGTVQQHLDIVYAKYGSRELHLDLFRPKNSEGEVLPAVLIVHGGGWQQGDKTRFRVLAQTLATRGYLTAAIEYRLAGEAKFPAAIHDCQAAVRWLRANAKRLRIDPERIAAVGGSAGGHLVGLLAAAPHVAELQGDGGNAGISSQVQAAVVMAGPMEVPAGPNAVAFLGRTIDEAPELYRLASPMTHLSAKTPPILFQHGEHDRPELNLAAREKLRELKIPTEILVYREGKHGCWNQHPWFGPMVDDIDAFLTKHLSREIKPAWFASHKTAWGEMRFGPAEVELHVAERPVDGILIMPILQNPIRIAYLRGDPARIALKMSPELTEWWFAIPSAADALNPLVVVVETVGRPYLPVIPRVISPAADGSLTLAAHQALAHGQNLRYEPQPIKNTIGYWSELTDWCQWPVYAERPGKYEVHILQGCGKGQGGSEVAVQIGGQTLTFTVEDTGHFQNFKERKLGVVEIAGPQVHALEIRPRTKAAAAVMDVRQVRLVPVE
ncbi:MAG: alpha/beta hydrolase [Pirellulaceae bacterium]|nr:alpha/beta hydrolase [Pirellulaceae bacterium]